MARRRFLGGVIAALLLAGCGSTAASGTAPHHPSRNQQIIAGFVAAEHAVQQVELTYPAPNPNDPRLLAHTAGPRLAKVQALIKDITDAGDISQGHWGVGRPKVTSVSKNGKSAVVTTCRPDDLITVTPLGQPVPGILGTPTTDGLHVTMRLMHGRWLEWSGTGQNFPYDGGHGKCPGF